MRLLPMTSVAGGRGIPAQKAVHMSTIDTASTIGIGPRMIDFIANTKVGDIDEVEDVIAILESMSTSVPLTRAIELLSRRITNHLADLELLREEMKRGLQD